MNCILEEMLVNAYDMIDTHKTHLKEYNLANDELDEIIQLYTESVFQFTHDSMMNQYYFIYNQWMKENINKKDDYCEWLKRIRREEDEEYLRRYNRRMKKV